MNPSEKFGLKWNDFQENVCTAISLIGRDNEFTDVTLACEDGNQVEAHKVTRSSEAQVRLTYPLDLLGPRLGRELTALSFRKTKGFSEVTLVREDNPKQDAKQDQR